MHDRGSRIVGLAKQAQAGLLEGLECPECSALAVAVWFTHPAEDEFRTWFVCAACGFQTRARNAGKPRYFSEERRRLDLEARDKSILESAIFKKPLAK